MPRYFTAPRRPRGWIADDIYDEPIRHVPTVCDHEARNTGLVDQNVALTEPHGVHLE